MIPKDNISNNIKKIITPIKTYEVHRQKNAALLPNKTTPSPPKPRSQDTCNWVGKEQHCSGLSKVSIYPAARS